jgi:hypothetical protein
MILRSKTSVFRMDRYKVMARNAPVFVSSYPYTPFAFNTGIVNVHFKTFVFPGLVSTQEDASLELLFRPVSIF